MNMNEVELASLAKNKSSQEFAYYNTQLEKKCSVRGTMMLELARMLEYMLARLLRETDPKTVLLYQKKIITIFNMVNFDFKAIRETDLTRLIKTLLESVSP